MYIYQSPEAKIIFTELKRHNVFLSDATWEDLSEQARKELQKSGSRMLRAYTDCYREEMSVHNSKNVKTKVI